MEAIIAIALIVVAILVLRLIGAWMLRIDEVIKNQKEIVKLMKKNNDAQ